MNRRSETSKATIFMALAVTAMLALTTRLSAQPVQPDTLSPTDTSSPTDTFAPTAPTDSQSPLQTVDNKTPPPGGPYLMSANGKINFANAQPEDITNKNFPDMIESFDYPNANIADVVKAISKLTGKNFIIGQGVTGKISIIAPSKITVAEAYKAFLTALAMNNYTVVPDGAFLKIRSLQEASKENIDTYSGAYFPHSDQLITRIIKLKYINADDIQKTLQGLINPNGNIEVYAPTNSLIITDLGSNIYRIQNIIDQLDVPGYEQRLVVIPIRYARAKDIADLISKIISQQQGGQNQFRPGFPAFRPFGQQPPSTGGAANYSLVLPDLRTNSIIVVGNDAGIKRIRGLVAKLDYPMRNAAGSGVYVYYVRYGDAESIAKVLNGIAAESKKEQKKAAAPTPQPEFGMPETAAAPVEAIQPLFGSDVKVTSDKATNSIVVMASRQDWDVIHAILHKLDIPRDQVFVKSIIMEMDATKESNWGVNYFKFMPGTNGLGRWDLVTSSNAENLLNPINDTGLNLGFGSSDLVTVNTPLIGSTMGTTGTTPGISNFQVPSLLGLINFIKTTTNANILSAPTLTAIDNEKSTIEVGEDVPISQTAVQSTNGIATPNIQRKDLTLKMEITPYISPDTNMVRLKLHNEIKQLAPQVSLGSATNLEANAVVYTTRDVNTQVIVNSGDTAVIGGLMQDKDTRTVTKVPILGDIPILGWLFKSDNPTKEKMDLLIFITPKIIRTTHQSHQVVNSQLAERLNFIKKYEDGRDPYGYEVNRLPRSADNLNVPDKKQSDNALAPLENNSNGGSGSNSNGGSGSSGSGNNGHGSSGNSSNNGGNSTGDGSSFSGNGIMSP